MLNYEVDARLLEPYVPAGTVLDDFAGRTYASLVGFRFLDTRVLGIAVPWHRNFDEVNLRFYVRRPHPQRDRRGVVFIKEIVPRRAIAALARRIYNENYVAMPMGHALEHIEGEAGVLRVEYRWRRSGIWESIAARTMGEAELPAAGSLQEFIAEHYWGYARQRDGGTVEYQVDHPPWRVWEGREPRFEADIARLYGDAWHEPLSATPTSTFVAAGSAVTVKRGIRIV